MNSKQKYIEYCNSNAVTLFMQPWYLDIVYNGNWNVMIYENDAHLPLAFIPYYIYRQNFFKSIRPMNFIPYQGVVINKAYYDEHIISSNSLHRLYSFENSISECFASQIDKIKPSACFLNFSPEFFCATPFVQHGFSANVKYTYRLDLTKEYFNGFSSAMRKKLRKAEKELYVTNDDFDLKEIFQILCSTYNKQHEKISYTFDRFQHLVTSAINRKQGKMFVCKDNENNIAAALFIVWDESTAYSLIGGSNYENNHRDAGALLQYQSINYSQQIGLKTYDFEGSMLKGVESFFQHFGATRMPYISLNKYYSKVYQHLRNLKH